MWRAMREPSSRARHLHRGDYVSSTNIEAHNSHPPDPGEPIERLLVLADVAVA
jgi:hypothetical protein